MKSFIIALAFTLSGCALVTSVKSQPTTRAQVITILDDAHWGVSAAHDQLWISDSDYVTIEKDFQAATFAVIGAMDATSARQAAKSTLQAVEQLLPLDSRLRPYIDAAIVLL